MNRLAKLILLALFAIWLNAPSPAGECQTENLVGGWNEFSCPPPACPNDVCETWHTTQFGGTYRSCRCKNTLQVNCCNLFVNNGIVGPAMIASGLCNTPSCPSAGSNCEKKSYGMIIIEDGIVYTTKVWEAKCR